jgi:hypothetical protein
MQDINPQTYAASSTSMAQFHTFMAWLRGCGFSSAKGLVMFPARKMLCTKNKRRRREAAPERHCGHCAELEAAGETAGWHSQELKLEVGSWRKWEVGWLLLPGVGLSGVEWIN